MHQSLCTYTPKKNVIIERIHHYLLETRRSLLLSSQFPSTLWENLFLQLYMSLIAFPLHIILRCLPMQNYIENFLIIPHYMFLGVHALFYDILLSELSCDQNVLFVYSCGMVLVKNDIDVTIQHVRNCMFIKMSLFWNILSSITFQFSRIM